MKLRNRFANTIPSIILAGVILSPWLPVRSVQFTASAGSRADEKDSEDLPGLKLQFQSLQPGQEGQTDARLARMVMLYVPAGETASPFLPVGKFKATWSGKIEIDLGSETTFSAVGSGKLDLKVNGNRILQAKGPVLDGVTSQPITLNQGANTLEVVYESPADGDAVLRLYWETAEFRREPLVWSVLRHPPTDRELRLGQDLREGRELVATQRCLRCHRSDDKEMMKPGAMPELGMDAPSFEELGKRLRPQWMARWIQDPAGLRPTATMPAVLVDGKTGGNAALDQRAADIASYLSQMGKPAAKNPLVEEEVQQGTRLFAQLGCLACHTPPDRTDFTDDEKKRIPLRDISAKWQPAALREFLLKPDAHYQWIRMPDFGLKEKEAGLLASYLLSQEIRGIFVEEARKTDPERGKQLLQSTGCLNCHLLKSPGLPSTLQAPAWENLQSDRLKAGCLDMAPNHRGPQWNLTRDQIKKIQAFAADRRKALDRDNATEFATRQMKILRCGSCHRRDQQEDDWSQLRDEEMGLVAALPPVDPESEPRHFKADQIRPSLTWTGEKLNTAWLTRFIGGKMPYKPREYLRARMPAFTRRADLLATGLAHEHGVSSRESIPDQSSEKLGSIGRELVGKKRWSCTACHDMGKTEAVGVFESPGPNFMYVKERIRREYYDRWIWLPSRVEPGTKMPQVYMFGKPSLLADILDGDASKQVEAIWQYILEGRNLKAPGE